MPLREAPVHSNWATVAQYRAIAGELDEQVAPSENVMLAGEIGTLAFYSDRRLLNEFSDANIATHLSQVEGSPFPGPLARIDHAWREVRPSVSCPGFILEHVPGEGQDLPAIGPLYGGILVRKWTTSTSWEHATLYLWRIDARAVAASYEGGCVVRALARTGTHEPS
jgi:hypothetical protein